MATPRTTEIRAAGAIRPGDDTHGAAALAERLRLALDELGDTPIEIARALTQRRMSVSRYIAEILYQVGPPWILRTDDFPQPADMLVAPDVIDIDAIGTPRRVRVKLRPGMALELFLRHVGEDARHYPEYSDAVASEPALGLLWAEVADA